MIRHYLTIAVRNILKHKVFSLINVFGLALGITCCLLIWVYVHHELRFDQFHAQADRIARVVYNIQAQGQSFDVAVTPNIVSPLMQRSFPEVTAGVRVYPQTVVVKREEAMYEEDQFLYVDSAFFDLFSFPLLDGTADALKDRQTLVITASMAEKYFGQQDPIGQTLELGQNQTPFVVKAVVADVPHHSHMQFDFLAAFHNLRWASEQETLGSANYYTYLLFHQPEDIPAVEAKIPQLVEQVAGPEAAANARFSLQPLTDIHLHSSHLQSDYARTSDLTYLYLFVAVGFLILLIACINYINLATARSVDRVKEIGLRKVVGASWQQLFRQFMGEAVLISLLAMLLSLGLIHLLLPYFNELARMQFSLTDVFAPELLLALLGTLLVVSLLAGSYPAFVFARFKPISVLRGSFKNSQSGSLLRKGLVVFQFTISVVLIASTLIMNRQLGFVQNKKLGYAKDQLLVMPNGVNGERLESFKAALQRHPSVEAVTTSTESPVHILGGYSLFHGHADDSPDKQLVTAMAVDPDFVETLQLHLIAGQDYTPSSPQSEGFLFLLNETAVRAMGWNQAEEAIGKAVNLNGRKGYVQGVIQDFHIAPLHQEIAPLVLFLADNRWKVLVRMSTEDVAGTLDFLREQWASWVPTRPFTYEFVDEQFAQLYKTEQELRKLFTGFAILAILIGCLGLFGLASYTAVQRHKEIGIRKVLGASVSQLMLMLSRDFSLLVMLAFVMGAPIAWLVMRKWLEGFAYKVSVGLDTLLVSGAVVLLIAWLTIAYQAFRAASANPIEALRDE